MSESHPDDHNPELEGLDYGESGDIRSIHQAVLREKADPEDGLEPLSLWLICFFGLILAFGGMYLGMFNGGFRADVYDPFPVGFGGPAGRDGAAAAAAGEKKELTLMEIGEKTYKQNCVACHQATGMGAAGLYPPLVGADWVVGNNKRLGLILLHGLEGKITVNGVDYNGAMPAWAKNLNDERIAGVLTYIRNSWGNAASEVQPDQIAWLRAEYSSRTAAWSEGELLAIESALPPSEVAATTEAPVAVETASQETVPADATTETPEAAAPAN